MLSALAAIRPVFAKLLAPPSLAPPSLAPPPSAPSLPAPSPPAPPSRGNDESVKSEEGPANED